KWERKRERWEQHMQDRRERWEQRMQHWTGHRDQGLRPTGNHHFDEYREEALRRLEEEANEFREFLERLRAAKDRAERDESMRKQRQRQARSGQGEGSGGGPQPSQT